ncbi:MAG: hypothetical protein C4321_08985 [Chloroflexota bacterium]
MVEPDDPLRAGWVPRRGERRELPYALADRRCRGLPRPSRGAVVVRSFRDRSPYAVGLAAVAVIGIAVGAAFGVGVLHLFERTYTVRAVFADAAGIRRDDPVRVAGVKVGRVVGIRPDRRHGNVVVELRVERGVDLGPETRAEIALGTLLGAKYVRLSGPVHRPHLADLPPARRVIPLSRTSTPFDVFDLTTTATRRVEATDTEKLNRFVRQLADITQDKAADVKSLIASIATVSAAINERDAQLRDLLDRFDHLSRLLAQKDQTIAALLDQSQGILDLLVRRRATVAEALRNTGSLSGELARLLSVNKARLDGILATLHPTLDVVARHEADLDAALAYLGPGALGLAKAASHGPWADIYVRALGPDLLQVIKDTLGGAGGGP